MELSAGFSEAPSSEPAAGDGRAVVVIPTYNEAANIQTLVERLLDLGDWLDVLVVDDGSPDGTAERVQRLIPRSQGRLRLVSRVRKLGRGGAVLAGFRIALKNPSYAVLAEMDGDLSHLPEELPSLIEVTQSADVVVGARYVSGGSIEGWPARRKLWSRVTNRMIAAILRVGISDYTNGYRAYRRSSVEKLASLDLTESGFIALSEWMLVLHDGGARIAQVPTRFVNRTAGRSNMGPTEALDAFRGLVRICTNRSQYRSSRAPEPGSGEVGLPIRDTVVEGLHNGADE